MDRLYSAIRRLLRQNGMRAGAATAGDAHTIGADVARAACELAEAAAGLPQDQVLDDLNGFVAGRINARLQHASAHAARRATAEIARASLMDSRREAAAAGAKSLREKADERLKGQPVERKRAAAAEAAIEVHRANLAPLPLLVKIQTSRWMMIATMTGTAGCFGALVWLSLQAGSVTLLVHFLIPIAGVMGAIAAELVLGTLGAEVYDRTPDERRRGLAKLAITVLALIIVATETFAGVARQEGAERTNNDAPAINPQTGQLEASSGSLTPSLLWTAPLSVLVTLSGAGVVGLRRTHLSRNDLHDGIRDSQSRLEAARTELREAERDAERTRDAADAQAREALRIGGEISAAKTRGGALEDELKLLSAQHTAAIEGIAAEARLVYRTAAAERADGASPPRRRAGDHRLPLIIGAAGMSGAAAADVTTSLLAGLVVGSTVMIGAGIRRLSQ